MMDIDEQVTQLLPVPTLRMPAVTQQQQEDANKCLIALLSRLCANPDEFIARAQEASHAD